MRVLWILILLAAGCGLAAEVVKEDAETIAYRQPDGSVVTLHKQPKRVVICYASLVPVWYAAGGSAIGVPRVASADAMPEAARELPVIGSISTPNPEKILMLKPDLALLLGRYERHAAVAEILNRARVETVLLEYANYTDFASLFDFFCNLNGAPPAALAEKKRISGEVEAACRKAAEKPGPTAAIVFASPAGFKLESEHSNTGTILKMLGGKNIAAGVDQPRVNFSYERLFVDDPEVIFIVTMGSSEELKEKFRREIMSQGAWKELRAAKSGRVHFLPAELFLYQAGTRYPEAFRHLAQLLYPELEGNK